MRAPVQIAFALSFLAIQATTAHAQTLDTFAPNIQLADGSPGYALKKLPGKRKPPTLLIGINPTDACIPTDPCTPQALSMSDPTRPSIFSDNDRTDYTLFVGLEIGAGATITIPGDPCSPLSSGNGVRFGIGDYGVQLFATPGGDFSATACAVRTLSAADLGDFSDFSAFSLSFGFAEDPAVTLDAVILDPTGAPLSYGDPAPIPEPPALPLLAAGIGALVWRRRRPSGMEGSPGCRPKAAA